MAELGCLGGDGSVDRKRCQAGALSRRRRACKGDVDDATSRLEDLRQHASLPPRYDLLGDVQWEHSVPREGGRDRPYPELSDVELGLDADGAEAGCRAHEAANLRR